MNTIRSADAPTFSRLNVRVSGNTVSSVRGQTAVVNAPHLRGTHAALDEISLNSGVCAVPLNGSVNSSPLKRPCLLVASLCVPTDCSSSEVEDNVYRGYLGYFIVCIQKALWLSLLVLKVNLGI